MADVCEFARGIMMRARHVFCFIALAVMLITAPAMAQVEAHEFADARRQSLYAGLLAELRCLVCANQNLVDSNADLAKDLRAKVFAMVQRGDDRDTIINYMSARYGDYVLYRPRLSLQTLLLWLGPFALALFGLTFVIISTVKKSRRLPPQLSAAQLKKVKALLAEKKN